MCNKMLWCQNDAIVAETSKRGSIPYKSTWVCNTDKLLSEHCVSTDFDMTEVSGLVGEENAE